MQYVFYDFVEDHVTKGFPRANHVPQSEFDKFNAMSVDTLHGFLKEVSILCMHLSFRFDLLIFSCETFAESKDFRANRVQ
jgi:hypothetical protein